MSWLKLGKSSQPLGEAVQGLGRGWGSTGKAGHDGRARAVMGGGGACFPRRTLVISGSGGALGAQVHMAKASGGTYMRGRDAGAWGGGDHARGTRCCGQFALSRSGKRSNAWHRSVWSFSNANWLTILL
jgi:hypothetical protein